MLSSSLDARAAVGPQVPMFQILATPWAPMYQTSVSSPLYWQIQARPNNKWDLLSHKFPTEGTLGGSNFSPKTPTAFTTVDTIRTPAVFKHWPHLIELHRT